MKELLHAWITYMEYLLHEKHIYEYLFIRIFSFIYTINDENITIFFIKFFDILLIYLNRFIII